MMAVLSSSSSSPLTFFAQFLGILFFLLSEFFLISSSFALPLHHSENAQTKLLADFYGFCRGKEGIENVEKPRNCFRKVDLNGDGLLSFKEFSNAWQEHSRVKSKSSVLRAAFDTADTNDDGFVGEKEFFDFLLKNLFQGMDENGDGKVNYEELVDSYALKQQLTYQERNRLANEEHLMETFWEMDRDNDGVILMEDMFVRTGGNNFAPSSTTSTKQNVEGSTTAAAAAAAAKQWEWPIGVVADEDEKKGSDEKEEKEEEKEEEEEDEELKINDKTAGDETTVNVTEEVENERKTAKIITTNIPVNEYETGENLEWTTNGGQTLLTSTTFKGLIEQILGKFGEGAQDFDQNNNTKTTAKESESEATTTTTSNNDPIFPSTTSITISSSSSPSSTTKNGRDHLELEFLWADGNYNEKLNADEFAEFWANLMKINGERRALIFRSKALKKFFHELDADGNNFLSFQEFSAALFPKPDLNARTRATFRQLDRNGDGGFTFSEIVDYLSELFGLDGELRENLMESHQFLYENFKKMDKNRDGVVVLDEFLNSDLKKKKKEEKGKDFENSTKNGKRTKNGEKEEEEDSEGFEVEKEEEEEEMKTELEVPNIEVSKAFDV